MNTETEICPGTRMDAEDRSHHFVGRSFDIEKGITTRRCSRCPSIETRRYAAGRTFVRVDHPQAGA